MDKITIGESLSTGRPFTIDANEVIMGRTFLSCITRYGKSWTNRRIVEKLFGKAGIVVFDPEGEYASLREKFPFLIIGKDVPLQIETAEFLAETVLKEDLSVIIDLSLTDEDTSKEYVAAFTKRFMFLETRLRKPYVFVVEEADEFAPEKGVAKATSLRAMKNLAKKGGKRGVGLIITTHRPAFVSKMVLSQCTTLKVIGRIEWPGDLDVIQEFLQLSPEILRRPKKNGKPIDDGKPHIDCLDPGEFYFAGSAVERDDFVKVGSVSTTHLGATPDLIPPTPKELTSVVERLKDALPKIIEQKIKPALPPVEEIKKEAEKKAEEKAEKKLQKAKRNLELKYKGDISERDAEIKELKETLEKVSRQATLHPTEPIKDVLEHPIVKTRMLELPQKAQDLLVKIEREPNLTREHLAAFLNASRDTVAKVINKINYTFKASVIVGAGRPIRYRSMLKRLYLRDVALREISEIERLQKQVSILEEAKEKLVKQRRELESTVLSLRAQLKRSPDPETVSKLQTEIERLEKLVKEHEVDITKLTKKTKQYSKALNAIHKTTETILQQAEVPRQIIFPEIPSIPVPESKPRHQLTDLRETIVNFLTNNPGVHFTEKELSIALDFDINDPLSQNTLSSLRNSNSSTVAYEPDKGYVVRK